MSSQIISPNIRIKPIKKIHYYIESKEVSQEEFDSLKKYLIIPINYSSEKDLPDGILHGYNSKHTKTRRSYEYIVVFKKNSTSFTIRKS